MTIVTTGATPFSDSSGLALWIPPAGPDAGLRIFWWRQRLQARVRAGWRRRVVALALAAFCDPRAVARDSDGLVYRRVSGHQAVWFSEVEPWACLACGSHLLYCDADPSRPGAGVDRVERPCRSFEELFGPGAARRGRRLGAAESDGSPGHAVGSRRPVGRRLVTVEEQAVGRGAGS